MGNKPGEAKLSPPPAHQEPGALPPEDRKTLNLITNCFWTIPSLGNPKTLQNQWFWAQSGPWEPQNFTKPMVLGPKRSLGAPNHLQNNSFLAQNCPWGP